MKYHPTPLLIACLLIPTALAHHDNDPLNDQHEATLCNDSTFTTTLTQLEGKAGECTGDNYQGPTIGTTIQTHRHATHNQMYCITQTFHPSGFQMEWVCIHVGPLIDFLPMKSHTQYAWPPDHATTIQTHRHATHDQAYCITQTFHPSGFQMEWVCIHVGPLIDHLPMTTKTIDPLQIAQ